MNYDLQDIYDFMIFCKNSIKGITQQSFYFDIDDNTIESIKSSILSLLDNNKEEIYDEWENTDYAMEWIENKVEDILSSLPLNDICSNNTNKYFIHDVVFKDHIPLTKKIITRDIMLHIDNDIYSHTGFDLISGGWDLY